MYFIRYIQYVTLIHCCYLIELNRVQAARALVITKENDQFKLAIPHSYNPDEKKANFKAPKQGKTYLFCLAKPTIKDETPNLRAFKEVEPDTEFYDTDKCPLSALSVFAKVKNPKNLKNNVWDTVETEMELYHSGYLLSTDFPEQAEEKPEESSTIKSESPHNKRNSLSTDDSEAEQEKHDSSTEEPPSTYEGMKIGPNFTFLIQIEAYYNKKIERIVAVEYDLLSTNLPYHRQFINKEYIAWHGKNQLTVPSILAYTNVFQYLQLFEGKMSDEWIKKLDDEILKNDLTLTMFASNAHFPIPVWERHSLQTFNLIPIWEIPAIMWERVQQFARIVAKHLGDLKVKTGVTGTMTLSNVEVEDKNGFKMPKYLWNVFEYHRENNVYGIIVVLNYNSFEKTDEKMCEKDINCETNGWIIGNDDFHTGELYCCEMTKDNIRNMEVNFMALKEMNIFNLHKWKEECTKIESEYKAEILTRTIDNTD